MIKKILLSLVLLTNIEAYANNLDQLFDVKLGKQTENKKDLLIDDKIKRIATYRINPSDYYGFSIVATQYTKMNHVYAISAAKLSDKDCAYDAAMITGILTNTYGLFKKVTEENTDALYMKEDGIKSIIIGCSRKGNKLLTITLFDIKIANDIKNEKLILKDQKN